LLFLPSPHLSPPPPTTSRLFQSDLFKREQGLSKTKFLKKNAKPKKKESKKLALQTNIAQENKCEYNMSVVVIVVLRLSCSLLLPSTRIVDYKIEVHCRTSFLPSFLRFLLSVFPAAVVAFCSCVGDSFATQELVFCVYVGLFFFSRFSSRFFVRERLTAYRCSLTAS
jgi:hypothetical protein